MKSVIRLTLLLTAFAFAFAACEDDIPVNGGNDNNSENNVTKERVIIYSVGNDENRQTLETEGEWDALLDRLCDQAQSGSEVSFYNVSQTTYLENNTKGATKENRTINTSSRDELKAWMKEMEKAGRTVRVIYDDNTGTWHGEAYATAPAVSTLGTLPGTWHFSCMVVTRYDIDGNLLGSDLYAPEDNGGSWYYSFSNDGTLTITVNGMDGTTATDSSTWTLSDDGILYSDLLPSGAYWNVNWITPNTMIISRADMGTEEGDLYYQLQFDAVTE